MDEGSQSEVGDRQGKEIYDDWEDSAAIFSIRNPIQLYRYLKGHKAEVSYNRELLVRESVKGKPSSGVMTRYLSTFTQSAVLGAIIFWIGLVLLSSIGIALLHTNFTKVDYSPKDISGPLFRFEAQPMLLDYSRVDTKRFLNAEKAFEKGRTIFQGGPAGAHPIYHVTMVGEVRKRQEAVMNENLLTEQNVLTWATLENKVMKVDKYEKYCSKDANGDCLPPQSLVRYFFIYNPKTHQWVSPRYQNFVEFSAAKQNLANDALVLNDPGAQSYVTQNFRADTTFVPYVRTRFDFSVPLPNRGEDSLQKQEHEIAHWLQKKVYSILADSQSGGDDIQVRFSGLGIDEKDANKGVRDFYVVFFLVVGILGFFYLRIATGSSYLAVIVMAISIASVLSTIPIMSLVFQLGVVDAWTVSVYAFIVFHCWFVGVHFVEIYHASRLADYPVSKVLAIRLSHVSSHHLGLFCSGVLGPALTILFGLLFPIGSIKTFLVSLGVGMIHSGLLLLILLPPFLAFFGRYMEKGRGCLYSFRFMRKLVRRGIPFAKDLHDKEDTYEKKGDKMLYQNPDLEADSEGDDDMIRIPFRAKHDVGMQGRVLQRMSSVERQLFLYAKVFLVRYRVLLLILSILFFGLSCYGYARLDASGDGYLGKFWTSNAYSYDRINGGLMTGVFWTSATPHMRMAMTWGLDRTPADAVIAGYRGRGDFDLDYDSTFKNGLREAEQLHLADVCSDLRTGDFVQNFLVDRSIICPIEALQQFIVGGGMAAQNITTFPVRREVFSQSMRAFLRTPAGTAFAPYVTFKNEEVRHMSIVFNGTIVTGGKRIRQVKKALEELEGYMDGWNGRAKVQDIRLTSGYVTPVGRSDLVEVVGREAQSTYVFVGVIVELLLIFLVSIIGQRNVLLSLVGTIVGGIGAVAGYSACIAFSGMERSTMETLFLLLAIPFLSIHIYRLLQAYSNSPFVTRQGKFSYAFITAVVPTMMGYLAMAAVASFTLFVLLIVFEDAPRAGTYLMEQQVNVLVVGNHRLLFNLLAFSVGSFICGYVPVFLFLAVFGVQRANNKSSGDIHDFKVNLYYKVKGYMYYSVTDIVWGWLLYPIFWLLNYYIIPEDHFVYTYKGAGKEGESDDEEEQAWSGGEGTTSDDEQTTGEVVDLSE